MFPFEYESLERPDEAICIFHNCDIVKSFGPVKKNQYYSKIKYNVDTTLMLFYMHDNLVTSVFVELEMEEMILKS